MANSHILVDIREELLTDRLLIRAPRIGDGQVVYEAVVESLAELREQEASLPWALAEPAVEVSETFSRESIANFITRRSLNYWAFDRVTGAFVGGIGFPRIHWKTPKFEIGYWRRTSRRGEGIIAEAVIALKNYALRELGARRVEILTSARNTASRRVAERAGFELEGILRNDFVSDAGEFVDKCVYAVIGEPSSRAPGL